MGKTHHANMRKTTGKVKVNIIKSSSAICGMMTSVCIVLGRVWGEDKENAEFSGEY